MSGALPSSQITIRPAHAGDVDAIRACARLAYAPYVGAIGRAPAPMVADFEALVARDVVHVAVNRDQTLLGFIVFFPQADAMLLENVAVHPAAVGQGVGKALIAFCEDQARHTGARAVTLYTNAAMAQNLRIYPHLGYRETGRRQQDGFDRVFFEKPL